MEGRFFLYDDREQTDVRYVSFMGTTDRYDLAIIKTQKYFGKTIVLDIQGNRFAIIGEDDLKEEGYIEYAFKLDKEAALELKDFLMEIV